MCGHFLRFCSYPTLIGISTEIPHLPSIEHYIQHFETHLNANGWEKDRYKGICHVCVKLLHFHQYYFMGKAPSPSIIWHNSVMKVEIVIPYDLSHIPKFDFKFSFIMILIIIVSATKRITRFKNVAILRLLNKVSLNLFSSQPLAFK